MIRAVFDTNLIVSAFFWGGLPLQAILAARQEHFQLVATEELIAELADVLSRDKFAARIQNINTTPESLVERYRLLVELVEATPIAPVILADPKDDKFVACAVGGHADYIVTGDHHLLDLGSYEQIEICTVNTFLAKIRGDE